MAGATTVKREFVPEMTVGEALAQLADGYGLPLEKLIHDLSTLLAS